MNSLFFECRKLSPSLKEPLIKFFTVLQESGDDAYFHPHPFTEAEADKITQYKGKDVYYVAVEENNIVGYAMLRGWDEGYEVPSLGLAIHPQARGLGIGKFLVYFLHAVARRKGAKKVMLKVYDGNVIAVKLYENIGYKFQLNLQNQLVGIIEL